jgi:molecular chaperone GrpE (heat shock protein)
MAHDKSTTDNNNEASGSRRFRLPKLFADSDDTASTTEATEETTERIAQRASELGVKLPAPTEEEVIVAANRPYEGAPRASVLRMSPEEAAAELNAEAAAEALQKRAAQAAASQARTSQSSMQAEMLNTPPVRNVASAPVEDDNAPLLSRNSEHDVIGLGVAGAVAPTLASRHVADVQSESLTRTQSAAPAELLTEAQRVLEEDRYMMRKLDNLEDGMEQMSRLLQEICDRGTAQDKVFDTLHSELQDYKNDFIYEHLKPVVRPLLFLYDSLEQFEDELALQERPQGDERRSDLSPALVRQNMAFFREQLAEALRICEVTPMQTPEGVFDPKCHKAVDIALVESGQENMIQRVVRSGWYLNGHVFRPAEVVVGKTTADYNAQIWNYGHGKNGEKPAAPVSAPLVAGDA